MGRNNARRWLPNCWTSSADCSIASANWNEPFSSCAMKTPSSKDRSRDRRFNPVSWTIPRRMPRLARRRGKPSGPRNDKLTIHRTIEVHPAVVPPGAAFKEFESFVVQDLVIRCDNTEYLRARYTLADGGSGLAPLPAGVMPVEDGHV